MLAVLLLVVCAGCNSSPPPTDAAPPDPIYKTINDPLLHFQTERLRWIASDLPALLKGEHGLARMRCDIAKITINQMIDVAPLDPTASPLAASIYRHCAITLSGLMLDDLITALSDPARNADPSTSPCLTTVAPVFTFIGDNPTDDPEIKRKRDIVFAACPDFAAKFKAFEDKLNPPPTPLPQP